MKSIEFLSKQERIATATPFFKPVNPDTMNWIDGLSFELDDEQAEEINQLITDTAAEAATRLLQFILDAGSDKQIIARLVCLQKLYDNKHGNWLSFGNRHNVTVKTIRAERDRIETQTGLYIQ